VRAFWIFLLPAAALFLLSVPAVFGQPSEGPGDGTFGRGGFDLGWGKPNDDDEEEDGKAKATPTPTPTPKKGDDSFFQRNVEETGAADKF
jgi:hypothetical protein